MLNQHYFIQGVELSEEMESKKHKERSWPVLSRMTRLLR
jgi:hypothetical protein